MSYSATPWVITLIILKCVIMYICICNHLILMEINIYLSIKHEEVPWDLLIKHCGTDSKSHTTI